MGKEIRAAVYTRVSTKAKARTVKMWPSKSTRKNYPRFAEKALEANLKLAEAVKELANARCITPAQLALAWVLAQGEDIVPIPGTKRGRYLEENMAARHVNLTADDLNNITARVSQVPVVGERYNPEMMARQSAYGWTPERGIVV